MDMENKSEGKNEIKGYKKIIIISCVCIICLILFVGLVICKNKSSNNININGGSLTEETNESEKDSSLEKINYFEVTFNSTGGTKIQNQIIQENERIEKPINPIRDGYNFIEWQLDGDTFDFNMEITHDIELIAIWEKMSITDNDFNNNINDDNSSNGSSNDDINENNSSNNEISYNELGVWYKDNNGLSVKLNTYTKEETEGYISYKISYTLKNEVLNSEIMEGSFKLFFYDNTGEPQYGGFDYMYYGDVVDRSYEWKVLKDRQVYVLEYNAEEPDAGLDGAFFRDTPIATSLHWRTP